MRSPLILGTMRARPEKRYHDIRDMLIRYAISEPAATPRIPNCGIGPRPRPSVPPRMICHAPEDRISMEGNFMLPVPRRTPAMLFKSQGITAPPKKIWV